MSDSVLRGIGSSISNLPRGEWEAQVQSAPGRIGERLGFMSEDHHLVRNFVVRELPRRGRALSLRRIAEALHLPRARASSIVEDLEKHRFFLVRGNGRAVSWAFPVTVEDTGHHLEFSTGERLDAA